MKIIFAALLSLPLLSGCASFSQVAEQLKDDPAIVSMRLGTPWGVQNFVRVGGQSNNTVTVSPDGTVKIEAK